MEALRSQKLDGLGFVPANLQEKVNKKSIHMQSLSLPQYTALFFNLEKADWRENKNVRDALAIAIDRNRIIRESLKDDGQIIESPILNHFNLVNINTTTPYAPDQANQTLDKLFSRVDAGEYRKTRREQILKELKEEQSTSSTTPAELEGLEKDADAELAKELSPTQTFYRQDKNKNILKVNLVTADTEEYRHTAELIAGFWQEVGIQVNLSFVNPKNIERDALRERKYDVLLYGIILGDSADPYPFWHSSQIKFPGVNLSQYTNRTVDGLLEKIRNSNSEADVKESYSQFNNLLLSDRPAVFLYSPVYRYMMSNEVKGVSMQQIYHPSDRFAGVTNWYIKTTGKWSLKRHS